MLHDMERKGYLYSVEERSGRQSRRLYRATDLGKMMLEDAKQKVRELFGELFEE
jgi:DNA-binding PadR family transcriptional regulator